MDALEDNTRKSLVALAAEARRSAYAPYSNFAVGAALLAEDGAVFTGCNVENASYGLSICAERNALFQAVAQGRRRFRAIAVAAQPQATPCGACRQALAEFAEDLEIILSNPDTGVMETTSLGVLFPQRFRLKSQN